jgi:hypothetical protein
MNMRILIIEFLLPGQKLFSTLLSDILKIERKKKQMHLSTNQGFTSEKSTIAGTI